MKTLTNSIERIWYRDAVRYWPLIGLLWPLSLLFGAVAAWRKRILLQKKNTLSAPLVVVGNISVGGTGKTPLLSALAKALTRRGIHVGIVSRGYGGTYRGEPRTVLVQDAPDVVGDEPLLLARATGCPVVIGHSRLEAAQYLLAHHAIDLVLSDDGLQHYRLPRQVEIAVLDAQRGVGNGFLLPAGPLRESVSRLSTVDFVVVNGEMPAVRRKKLPQNLQALVLNFLPECWVSVKTGEIFSLDVLDKKMPIHAVAGIGYPERFFSTLRQLGFSIIEHAFPDHHVFSSSDLAFGDDNLILMTEKDAVKCAKFSASHWYALRVAMPLQDEWIEAVLTLAQQKHQQVTA